MYIVAILVVLIIIAIALNVPMILLVSTLVGIFILGVAVYKLSSLFSKKRG